MHSSLPQPIEQRLLNKLNFTYCKVDKSEDGYLKDLLINGNVDQDMSLRYYKTYDASNMTKTHQIMIF